MYCCEKLNNKRIKFDFYTTLLHLIFIWYCFLPLWERFEKTKLKSGLCYKSTFSNISNITFVQILINLPMYYHALLLNRLQKMILPLLMTVSTVNNIFVFSYIAISANVLEFCWISTVYTTLVKCKSSFSLNSLPTSCLLGLLSEFNECSQNAPL